MLSVVWKYCNTACTKKASAQLLEAVLAVDGNQQYPWSMTRNSSTMSLSVADLHHLQEPASAEGRLMGREKRRKSGLGGRERRWQDNAATDHHGRSAG